MQTYLSIANFQQVPLTWHYISTSWLKKCPVLLKIARSLQVTVEDGRKPWLIVVVESKVRPKPIAKGARNLQLTELESRVMKVVWDLAGRATVTEILENWQDTKVPKYTTVLKIFQILEEKGVVRHKKKGKAYIYVAKMSRDDSLRHNLKKIVNDFFGGNRVLLASSLISGADYTPEELKALQRAIAEKEKGMKNE